MASPVSRVVRKKVGTRDWSELPLDAIASIFGKLDAIEILMGSGLVCRSWLAAAKLPDLWRSVDMAHHKFVYEYQNQADSYNSDFAEAKKKGDVLCAMARVAVDRSGGQMEEFVGRRFVTDELLDYIGDRSPALKTLGLISCCPDVTNPGFTYFIAKCPMLEDLKLLECHYVGCRNMYESIGKTCSQLKRFTLRNSPSCAINDESSGEALGFAAMHELRSLTLVNSDVTNEELMTILDGCPHLEFLELSECFLLVDDSELRVRCAAIKSLMVPYNNYATDILDSIFGRGPRPTTHDPGHSLSLRP